MDIGNHLLIHVVRTAGCTKHTHVHVHVHVLNYMNDYNYITNTLMSL